MVEKNVKDYFKTKITAKLENSTTCSSKIAYWTISPSTSTTSTFWTLFTPKQNQLWQWMIYKSQQTYIAIEK